MSKIIFTVQRPVLTLEMHFEQKRTFVWQLTFKKILVNNEDVTKLCRTIRLENVRVQRTFSVSGNIVALDNPFDKIEDIVLLFERTIEGRRGSVVLQFKDGTTLEVYGEKLFFQDLFGGE